MTRILFAIVLVFGLGGYFAGRVIGAEPGLPTVSGPVSIGDDSGRGGADDPASHDINDDRGDDGVEQVHPDPSDIGDDNGDDGPRHDLGDDHGGDNGGSDDNSGPGSSGSDHNSGPGSSGSDDNSGPGSSGSDDNSGPGGDDDD